MSELDALPADQRAALQLLLKQGQSYEQLGELLKIDADSVRRRAVAALEAVGPESGRRLDPERRGEITDYLLGQQTVSQRESTRAFLADSAAARAWARAVAGTLRPLAPDAIPEVPAEPETPRRREAEAPAKEEEEPAGYEAAAARVGAPDRPASRLSGALLLGGLGIIIAVVLILVIGGGGDDDDKASTLSTNPTQTSTTPSRPTAQINLFSPRGGSRTVGLAQVFQMGNRRAIIVAGQGLRPGAYALWLYNSGSDAKLLGFVPERVGRDGRFATQGELSRDAERFRLLVVTRETVTRQTRRPPTRPGSIVLQGELKLGR